MYILYNNYFIIIKYCRQFIETALHTLLHQVNFRVYLREKLLHFYCKKSVCSCTQITLHMIPSTSTLHFYQFPHPKWQIAVWMCVIKHKCHSQITGSLIHCFNNKPAYPSIPTNPSFFASCLNSIAVKIGLASPLVGRCCEGWHCLRRYTWWSE